MNELIYKFKTVQSPVGLLKLVASSKGLAAVLWENDEPGRVRLQPQMLDEHHRVLNETEKQLAEFFAGKRTVFDLPLDFKGTVFQKAVWHELLKVPFGQVKTYSEIAKALGNPKAVRAVGAANGKNPISIICPCHRIIGANGMLTGFAGGLDIKATLLRLEHWTSHDSTQFRIDLQQRSLS